MNNAIQAAIQSKPFLLTSEVTIALNAQKMMTDLLGNYKPNPTVTAAYTQLAAHTALSVPELQTIWELGLQEICTVVAAMNADAVVANKNHEQSLVPNSKLRETKVVILSTESDFPANAIAAGRYASMVVNHLSMRVQGQHENGASYRLQAAIQRQAGFSSVVNNYVSITDTDTNTIYVQPVPSDFTVEDAPRINYNRRSGGLLAIPSQNKDLDGGVAVTVAPAATDLDTTGIY